MRIVKNAMLFGLLAVTLVPSVRAWNCPSGQIRQQAPAGTPTNAPYYDVVEGIAFICVPATPPVTPPTTTPSSSTSSSSANSTSTSQATGGSVSNSGNNANTNKNTAQGGTATQGQQQSQSLTNSGNSTA